ncbi:MAG TPA: recombinase family protein [Acetobacteraceae bacterium]
MRAAIYARYSSENQREASLEDQREVCRRYIDRQGWTLIEIYEDAAISGASRFRPGFARLTAEAEAGRFDVIVCEAIDRLGRKLADVADLFDRLTFHRVQIHATSIGLITQMHVGIMGTMAQMFLSDLREKTKRGQLGRARAGRIPGGLAYGYRVVTPAPGSKEAGERTIDPAEAAIVRRIFRDYAAGKSPRGIARELNTDAIPGPGGRPWGDTTIRGQVDRGTGILNNTLYIGRLSWNRCSYVKDPRTGRRVARVNQADQREEREVPELRILEQELWDRTHTRQATLRFDMGRDGDGNALNRAHRRQFLLSGLLVCGCCGGGYTIIGKDRYGCATRRGKGTCDNGRAITRQRIEARVLHGLKDRLLAPELVADFVRAYAEEMATVQRQASSQRDRLKAEHADTDRRLQGVLKAIENGAWSDALRSRLAELEARKRNLESRIEAAGAQPPPIQLHPGAAEIYRAKVADLEAALNAPEIRSEASEALRALIERVTLTTDPDAPDGLRAELHGDLAMILRLGEDEPPATAIAVRDGRHGKPPRTGVRGGGLSVVAGRGFEPLTFRL